MRVLITGGAGFVGSHLSEAFLERGDEVYVLDDLSTGSIDNISHLKDRPRFHYTIDTVTNEPLLAERAFRAGARGYLTKLEMDDTVLLAIRSLLDGQKHVGQRMKGEP